MTLTYFCPCRGHLIAEDVAQALAYLHRQRVVHLDIKSRNVLLTRFISSQLAMADHKKHLTLSLDFYVLHFICHTACLLFLALRQEEQATPNMHKGQITGMILMDMLIRS